NRIFLPALALVASAMMVACGGGAANSNANAKPANANTNTAANTANTNTATANSAAAPAAGGDTINLEEGGVTMTVPAGFKHEKEGNDILVTTPEGGVEIMLTVPADGDYDKARKDAAKDIDKYVTDVKINEQDVEKKINGLDAITYNGTGKDKEDGKDVHWAMTLVKTDKKPVLIVAYAEKDALEKNNDKLMAFLNSIKKS
ncbi:MAG TPA: hypothetical protein VL501_07550, partial [Pyrinomonadaceae bacterium]|nr:hypothetical protein [Pyrinomonadaceae bacterium]